MIKRTILFLQFILLISFSFSQEVLLSLDGGDLNYESSVDIAGFQFFHNGCVTGASGGDAAAAGFMVSASGSAVIGFSLSGAVISAGSGTLVELAGEITEDCLSDFVFSDAGGGALEVAFEDSSADDGGDTGGGDASCPDGTDVCLSLDGGNLNYESSADIAGFQFFHNGCVTGASGGDAAAAGFMVSASGSAVIGFSLSGAVISAGAGTLLELAGEITEDCLSDFIFSDAGGGALEVAFEDSSADDGGGGDTGGGDASCPDGTDVCLSLDGGNLNYESSVDIAGFQFFHNGCVTGASGGDAAAAGFMVSASGSAVIGFSLSGAVISAGSGTLVELAGEITEDCLSDFVFSDSNGVGLAVAWAGDDIDDCSSGVYDCAGVCDGDAVEDCAGECAGSAMLDECGECGGDGPEENFDCDGNCTVDEDECGECGGDGSSCSIALSLDGANLNYDSGSDIAGFQFSHNGCVTGTSGGDAADAGFMVSASSTAVIGFSLTGAVIPAGVGTLLVLDGDIIGNCLFNFIVSNPSGGGLNVTYLYEGCTDSNACNYDESAGSDDGSCEYAEENYDCDENCIVDVDCSGECGGDAVDDECGECGGDNSSCTGCTDPAADNYDSDAIISCDDCCESAGPETVDYCLELHFGANLISFYALPDDISLTNVMASLDGVVSGVIGEGVAASPNPVLGWVGSLSAITPTSGYWVKVNADVDLCLEGATMLDASSILYNLHFGANLISFPYDGEVGIADAIPDDVEGAFTGLIGEGVAASPNPVMGWVGSLSAFQGGKGYWAKVDQDIAFNFDVGGDGRISDYNNENNSSDYAQSIEQSFYFIENIVFSGNAKIEEGDMILAYNDNVLVGSREWSGAYTDVPAMGSDGSDMTIGYCDVYTTPDFKLIKADTGIEYNLTGDTPSWEFNGIFDLGTVYATQSILPDYYAISSVYPNPFNPSTNITVELVKSGYAVVSVYNANGQEVSNIWSGILSKGAHSFTWDAGNQPSGIYFARLNIDSVVNSAKLMLLK